MKKHEPFFPLCASYRAAQDLATAPHGREFLAQIDDLLRLPYIRKLAVCAHHGSVSRLEHMLHVAYLTYVYALRHRLHAGAAARGAFLHDYFTCRIPNAARPHSCLFVHPEMACRNAARYVVLTPLEKDCILHHMWPLTPRRPLTPEARAVARMDKYCSIRELCLYVGQTIL